MTSYAASFAGHRSSSLPFHGYATRKPSLITLVSRRRAVVAAVSNGSPEGPGSVPRQPLFSDSITAKNASKPRDVHASSQNDSLLASEPAPASLLGSVTWQGSKDFDRLLNLGALSAGAALILATALNAGPDPWQAYQDSVALNPIETKACISGIVYSLGDLIAQTYEGREIGEWDRGRVIRSGLCGLLAHGPLSHLYYLGLDHAFAQQTLIPTGSLLVPLVKVGIDQTVWSLFWNSTYYVLLGLLKMESPQVIVSTVRSTWWDLLKAGWRLWPLVHIFTYGVIPVQHRLLFVDAVELVWVSILSLYGQQQRQETDATEGASAAPAWVACPLPGADGEGGDPVEEILRGIQVQSEVVFETASGERVVMTPAEAYAGQPVPVEVPTGQLGGPQ